MVGRPRQVHLDGNKQCKPETSHDWPSKIWEYGNEEQLLRFKPFFEQDMKRGDLGSKPCGELLHALKPNYWFSAHLHCKFTAVVPHSCGKMTKFLALDKCLPNRRFLQMVELPHDDNLKIEVSYDVEWLAILRLTSRSLSIKPVNNYLPGPKSNGSRWCYTPTESDKAETLAVFGDELRVPETFVRTAKGYKGPDRSRSSQPVEPFINPQTVLLSTKLQIEDPLTLSSKEVILITQGPAGAKESIDS